MGIKLVSKKKSYFLLIVMQLLLKAFKGTCFHNLLLFLFSCFQLLGEDICLNNFFLFQNIMDGPVIPVMGKLRQENHNF